MTVTAKKSKITGEYTPTKICDPKSLRWEEYKCANKIYVSKVTETRN